MAVDNVTLGNNLKTLRLSRRISQEEVTNFMHMTRSTYSNFETGQKVPDLQTLDGVCALYDINLDSLINYDLTKGLIRRIIFDQNNKDLADILYKYQALSLPSKFLLRQRVEILIEKEYFLFPYKPRLCKNERKNP